MDLDTTRYETFDDLFEYCRRVASAVGLICIRIFGCRERGGERLRAESGRGAAADQHPARRQGRSRAGRVYLPLEDLPPYGCTVDDLEPRHVTGPVRELLAFECRRAREFYERAVDGAARRRIAGGWWRPRSCGRCTSRR